MSENVPLRFEWEQQTRDSWIAHPTAGVSIAVRRNRSWRKMDHAKPFRTEVLGNHFADRDGFASLSEAQKFAEATAKKYVEAMVRAFGIRTNFAGDPVCGKPDGGLPCCKRPDHDGECLFFSGA